MDNVELWVGRLLCESGEYKACERLCLEVQWSKRLLLEHESERGEEEVTMRVCMGLFMS